MRLNTSLFLRLFKFLSILLIGTLLGCNHGQMEAEELNVLNQTFLDLVGKEYYYTPLPVPPFPLSEESTHEDSLRYINAISEFQNTSDNRKPDTLGLKILLSDTLHTYEIDQGMERVLNTKSFKYNFPVDTSWIKLIRRLDKIEGSRKFDLAEITNVGRYSIVSKEDFFESDDEMRRVGVITFSRVAFSENFKRGVFYFSFVCGGLCGSGNMVFVERKADSWVIVAKQEMWVS